MKILLVEDDIQMAGDMKSQFNSENIVVDIANDGFVAEKYLSRNQYDILLLDVNIPGKNGFKLLEWIRKEDIKTPVIMITAFGELSDKLQGFEYGADDYITKPFYFKELLARIKALSKRTGTEFIRDKEKIVIEDLIIDLPRKMVYRHTNPIKLTAKEFELLRVLAEANGNPVSKKELLDKVWGVAFETASNTLEVFVNLLRNKIDKDFEPKLIKTRIGHGYCLTSENI